MWKNINQNRGLTVAYNLPCGNKMGAEDEAVGRRRREVKTRFVFTRSLTSAGQSARHTRGILVCRRCSVGRAKLLAADKDDLGSQIYRYTDKPELRGALGRKLGPLPEMKPSQLPWKHSEKPSRVEAFGLMPLHS